jgi:RNA polymerase primary sigma factor
MMRMDCIGVYLKEINATPLLKAEEERELAIRVAAGDEQARDHMLRANLRLVVSIACYYQDRGVPLDDLIQFGNMGLMHALDKFDYQRGFRFSTYASFWIRQSVRAGIGNTGRVVRIPSFALELVVKWHKTANDLNSQLGRAAKPSEIAGALHLSARKVAIVRDALRLQTQFNSEHKNSSPCEMRQQLDMIPDRYSTNPWDGPDPDEIEDLLEGMKELLEREQQVLRMHFGLNGCPVMTFAEIGKVFNMTRQRALQIQQEALAKLRERMGVLS